MMKDAKDGVEAAGPSGGDPARLSTLPPGFPKGLRVLVVDDDSLCLKVIEQMLRKCDYSATMCINGSTALQLLRERPGDFDLVLSDVYMPDMDGFKLLEVVGLEMDLPVIMMSSNSETGTVLRGVTHGAVDFLIKPVRIEELRNVWQHVVRRRRELALDDALRALQVRDLDSEEHSQETVKEEVADGPRKRKELGYSPGDQERPSGGDDEANASKKPRVTWSVEMHQKFVAAVNVLGVDKAVPKKILEIMGVDGLTRENVASHLQKYRLYLKRVQGAPPAVHSHTPRVGGGGGTRSANTSSGLQPATSLAGGLQLPAQQQLPGAGQSSSQLQPALHGPAGPQGAPTASGQHQQQPQQPQQQQQPQGAAPGQEGHQAGQPHAQGPGGGPPGGPLPPFPGPLGPLGNGAMGLNPLLNPMGLNPMGLPGPMGLPSVSPLGMLPGMPGGQGMAGLPGPLALPGMGLNPLSFMASMGMGPLALPPNGMAGLPGGVGLAGLTLGGPNMGLGHHPGLGALTNGAAHLGPLPPGMPAGLGPSVTPPPAANPLTAPPPTTPGGAQPQPHNGAPGQGTQALRGQEPGGGGVQGGGAAASPDPLDPGSPDGLGLDLADLAEPLGDLMQSDGPGGADMAGLLGVRDMDTGFPDDLEGGPGMDPLLGAPDGKDPAMDDVLNYFLKG